MVDLKLENDEGIIIQTTDVEKYAANDKYTEIYEMYLTNKNLIYVYEKSNGLFAKTEDIVEKVNLDEIKVVNGKVQIFKIDDDDYGLGLQVLFKNGSREHFVFEKEKELELWYNSIIENIIGEIPSETKEVNNKEKVINNTRLGTFGAIGGLKNAIASAKTAINDIKNQVVEEFKDESTNSENDNLDEYREVDNSNKKEEKNMYCSNCGEKINTNSKFCNYCGTPVGKQEPKEEDKEDLEEKEIKKEVKTETKEYTERKTVYEGKIYKCPNCGENLKSFTANCPTCGYELRGSYSTSAVAELAEKIAEIESKRENKKVGSKILSTLNMGEPLTKTDEQKISLIRSFPIPNTKEDLYEFLILSKSNIEIDLYENTQIKSARLAVSDAWKAKFEQAYHKAKLLFKNDERMAEIQEMFDETNKQINNAKRKIWKLLGIIYGILFGIIIITLIIVAICGGFSSDNNTDKESNNVKIEETNNNNSDEKEQSSSNNSDNNADTDEYIKATKVEYTVHGNYLTGIVTITNTDSKKVIEYPSFRITAYGKDGKILGSEDRVLNILYPKQTMVDVGTLIEISEEPDKVEVSIIEPEDYNIKLASSLEHPTYKEMKCQNISVNNGKITGEVYNPNEYKMEQALITIIFRDKNNKVISSEYAFVDNIKANGKVPFDISLASDEKTSDKIEAYAYIW